MTTTPQISQETVGEFVIAAHHDLGKVKDLHAAHPELLNARYVPFNETAVEAASHMGNREIAGYLLASGVPMVICTAAMLGLGEQVGQFLNADPSLSTAKGAHGITVMYHAALGGRPEIGEMLLARGGGEGMSDALHAAVKFGHADMVQWLLTHGATDIEVLDFEKKTPLQVAEGKGDTRIAELLREHGAAE